MTYLIPKVYTFGMSDYAVINLKTDPALKAAATKVANKLGVSISAVLNNELRRFAAEQSVSFDIPEAPNSSTAKALSDSRRRIEQGDYHKFKNNEEAFEYLSRQLT